MREIIRSAVQEARSLDDVCDCVIRALGEVRKNGNSQIGYVSGIITSDGPGKIQENIERLVNLTNKIRSQFRFPIFSATDVFDDALFARIDAVKIPQDEWLVFWRKVLSSGFVTDVFMTPRWEVSRGARDEHQTAQSKGLNIVNYP